MLSFTKLVLPVFVTMLAALGSSAIPAVEKRDIWSPPVTYPHTGTVWTSGQRHNVTWNTANPPANVSNGATILLRLTGTPMPVILAQNFDLHAGRVEVTVPWVQTRNDYEVVLLGDSGNVSPAFTINEN
ncbi:uncharacterized protein BXZ73DRAFT_102299 [Epithele typhae]|uniref:uncharacterized protein n=1 Tax=Epithele typhae TaxID=378194 RepID=UPI0020086C86|nr:uncharacterized protein BXZ73DRAFT_102299 [Epithele typhae]KAH9928456.1 hypothetical protein BXZ73DRAFT_102299 [Epithele typhae]